MGKVVGEPKANGISVFSQIGSKEPITVGILAEAEREIMIMLDELAEKILKKRDEDYENATKG